MIAGLCITNASHSTLITFLLSLALKFHQISVTVGMNYFTHASHIFLSPAWVSYCVCVYILYIYIYIYTHTHTHTHTVTYITIEVHNDWLLYKVTYNYMLWLVIVRCCHWTYRHAYIYICVCVCVCACACTYPCFCINHSGDIFLFA